MVSHISRKTSEMQRSGLREGTKDHGWDLLLGMSVRAAAGGRAIFVFLGLLQRVIGRQAQDFRHPRGCAWPSQRRGDADVYCEPTFITASSARREERRA